MDRIHDLTNAQLVALTQDQIQRYIDIECLHEEVPLLPASEPVEPYAVRPEPDQTVYKIGNFEFATEEDAFMVLKAMLQATRVNLRYTNIDGETFQTVEAPSDWDAPKITTAKGFSKEAWIEGQLRAKEYAAAVKTYKELKKEYDAAVNGRKKCEEEVWTRIHEAREQAARRDRYIHTFQQYLELADGDRRTAWKFFLAAHPAAEDMDGLQEELRIDEPEVYEETHA